MSYQMLFGLQNASNAFILLDTANDPTNKATPKSATISIFLSLIVSKIFSF
jgi:hypothetical protein